MKTNLANSYVNWLVKESGPVTADELRYALKKHEDRETPEQEAEESEKEQDIEHRAGIHEKRGSSRDEAKRKISARKLSEGIALAVAPGAAATALSQGFVPAALGLTSLDRKLTPAEARSFVKKVSRLREMKVNFSPSEYMHDLDSKFSTIGLDRAKKIRGTVSTPTAPALGTLAHELGHADSYGKKLVREYANNDDFVRRGLSGFKIRQGIFASSALLPGAVGLLSGENETAERIAPYVGLAAASPVLVEEGAATLKGLRDIRRIYGTKQMLKSAPGLVGAFGTYLGVPLGAGLATKFLLDRRKKARLGDADLLSEKTAFWTGFEKSAISNLKAFGAAGSELLQGNLSRALEVGTRQLRKHNILKPKVYQFPKARPPVNLSGWRNE